MKPHTQYSGLIEVMNYCDSESYKSRETKIEAILLSSNMFRFKKEFKIRKLIIVS